LLDIITSFGRNDNFILISPSLVIITKKRAFKKQYGLDNSAK